MNLITRTAFGLICICIMSCQEEYGIHLRIENSSKLDFQEVLVNNVSFGSLKTFEVSSYVPFENIYESEYIKVVTGDRAYQVIPEGYDRKALYESGNYKYILDIDANDKLRIQFVLE